VSRLIIAIVTASVCVAGCDSGSNTDASGSNTGTDPKEWASQVCGLAAEAGEAWQRPMREAQAEIASMTRFEPSRIRRVLVRAISETLSVQDETIKSLDDVGAPDAEGGDEVQRTLLAVFVQMRETTEDFRRRARAIPVDTREHFFASLEAFASDFNGELAEAAEPASEFAPESDLGELKEAWESEPACKGL
jgi:hypothetical protein